MANNWFVKSKLKGLKLDIILTNSLSYLLKSICTEIIVAKFLLLENPYSTCYFTARSLCLRRTRFLIYERWSRSTHISINILIRRFSRVLQENCPFGSRLWMSLCLYVHRVKVGSLLQLCLNFMNLLSSNVMDFSIIFRTESSCFFSCDGQEWQGDRKY